MADRIDPETGVDLDYLEIYFQECALAWAETEKIENEAIGRARAQQELAFRDAIVTEKSEKIGKSEKWIWITVNPKKGTKLPDIVKAARMFKKVWVKEYAYVYENTDNNHIHIHGLIKLTIEPARARKELASSCKTICDTALPSCFKFVIIDSNKAIQKMEYMRGNKQPKKLENVEITKKWRESEKLKEIYESEEHPILLVPRETMEIDWDIIS